MTDAAPAATTPLPYENIADALAEMTQEVFEVNDANGWFDVDRTFGDDIALLHSEVSEMFEAFRDWGADDVTDLMAAKLFGVSVEDIVSAREAGRPHLAKPQGIGSEAADILIRLLDTCRRYEVNLAAEYVRKMAFNRTRGYHHGGNHHGGKRI